MAEPAAPKPPRRRAVKKLGKKLFHGVSRSYISRQSLIPDEPVLDAANFPWVEQLRAQWPAIREELDRLLRHRAELPNFHEISPDQYRLSTGSQWKTFFLLGFGVPSPMTQELCPATMRALECVPELTTAMFSILAPHTHIPKHTGISKGFVRCHLALKVPKPSELCRMTVGDRSFHWEEGEVVFFDDTTPHEVRNDSDEERIVLFFDFTRPMTRRGRFVHRLMMFALRRTNFFKDGLRNQRAWEAQYRELREREAA